MDRISFDKALSQSVREMVQEQEEMVNEATLPELRREAERHGYDSVSQYLIFLSLVDRKV